MVWGPPIGLHILRKWALCCFPGIFPKVRWSGIWLLTLPCPMALQLVSTYRGSEQWGCHESLYWPPLPSFLLTDQLQRWANRKVDLYALMCIQKLCLIECWLQSYRQSRHPWLTLNSSPMNDHWKWTFFDSKFKIISHCISISDRGQPNWVSDLSFSPKREVFAEKGGWLRVRQRSRQSSSHIWNWGFGSGGWYEGRE